MKNLKTAITIIGAYLAFQIGSGVATGQEIMQYYTPYGWKAFGTAAVIAIIFMIANYGFAYAGKYGDIEKGSDVFAFYCGPKIGIIFDVFSVIFCYMSYVVMVAGAASTLKQQYNIPVFIGALIVVILAAITVALGLNSIVDIIGKIGPVIVCCILVVAIISLAINGGNIPANIAAINTGEIELTKAGANWFMSGVSNGGFGILWLAGFTGVLAKEVDFKMIVKSSTIAFIILVLVNAVIGFSILAQIDILSSVQIPNLVLAQQIWAPLANIFGILIFAAIYTSACPLLWTGASRFAKEGTKKFKVLTAVLAVIGLVVALYIPFNVLMNVIYVLNGYIGFIVLAFMVIKMILLFKRNKSRA